MTPGMNSLGDLEVWFLTGSQHLYGEETLLQVAAQSGRVAAVLDAAGEVPVRVVWKPVLTDPDDGTELLIIDEATTLRDMEQRITANAAYYRLARGI
jgi:L-arabinose isomerase